MRPQITLVPFTAELLPAVQPWFDHHEVRHRPGGPDREGRIYYLWRR